MKFNCTKCGACCRFVGKAMQDLKKAEALGTKLHPAQTLLLNFPFPLTADGTCEKYDPEIGCTIYEDRPVICRVNKMYHLYQITVNTLTEAEFNYENARACNLLMENLNIDESFRIPLNKTSI